MTIKNVLDILDCFERSDIAYWIGGGWGVDALIGEQTREHDDLDVGFHGVQEARLMEVLEDRGFIVASDWRPVRFAMKDAKDRCVDAHPVVFDEHGVGWQANVNDLPSFRYPPDQFTQGRIGERTVPCIDHERQIAFHTGYEPTNKDHADMRALANRLGVGLPVEYSAV